MIDKLKIEIKKFFDARVRLIMDQQNKNQQTILSYHQITQLFKDDNYIPFSNWTISPNTIMHVLNDITINKRKNIIEFGAGASTFYIAKLIKVLGLNAVFHSVESDEKWANELYRQLKVYTLEDHVKIIFAPLEKVPSNLSFKEQKTWYSIPFLQDKLINIEHFDLVLVDGPVGGSTPYARYSAIPFLMDNITVDSSIFLDDVDRTQEAEIAKEWELLLSRNIHYFDRYALISGQINFDSSPFQLSKIPF